MDPWRPDQVCVHSSQSDCGWNLSQDMNCRVYIITCVGKYEGRWLKQYDIMPGNYFLSSISRSPSSLLYDRRRRCPTSSWRVATLSRTTSTPWRAPHCRGGSARRRYSRRLQPWPREERRWRRRRLWQLYRGGRAKPYLLSRKVNCRLLGITGPLKYRTNNNCQRSPLLPFTKI